MKLYCKPGQLARVISSKDTDNLMITDAIVRVTKLCTVKQAHSLLPHWFLSESMWRTCDCGCGRSWLVDILPDELLRPIEDPNDDAVDEVVAKVGKAPVFSDDWTVPAVPY